MSLLAFFEDDPVVEFERRRRICVALWAWAYEKHSDSLVSDAKFDETCYLIDKNIKTGNDILDKFFSEEFDPSTGQWVHKHPEQDKLEALYHRIRSRKK